MIWHLGSEQNHVEKFSDSIFGLRATFGQIKKHFKIDLKQLYYSGDLNNGL